MKNILIKLIIFLFFFYSCSGNKNKSKNTNENVDKIIIEKQSDTVKELSFEVINIISHNETAFTQGLIFYNGYLYESTGLEGMSKLYKIDVETGKILKHINLDSNLFGEGITIVNNKIYQVTWHNQLFLQYDVNTFKKLKEVKYYGECWGLTNNDSMLILSDGSSYLRFIDTNNFSVVSSKLVTYKNKQLTNINELELIGNKLFANIWGSDIIVIIDINTGKVIAQLDITELHNIIKEESKMPDVANGIAYNSIKNTFYITGKNWNKIFEIKIR